MSTMIESSPTELLERARLIEPEIIGYRRHIHANPELSFKETRTAAYVAEKLKSFGLAPKSGVGQTGVIVDIGEGAEAIAIRADMDALPIQESNDVPYCSKNEKVMHACGHDVHTACALGAARLLADRPPANGRIRIIFQPAEEATNSDGISGAGLMLRDGALDGIASVVALHVFPEIAAGKIALRSGPVLAAADKFDLKIQGKGSHGAWPHLGVDAIAIAAQVVQAIQLVVSRRISALEPAVITIGGMRSTTFAPNIIAEAVEMTGTVRYFHKQTQPVLRREIENACRIAEALGGSYELRYISENPAVVNDQFVVAAVDAVARQMLGEESIEEASMHMGAEDFSFMSEQVPSCFIYLGAAIEGDQRMLHTSSFDVDEKALSVGAALLTASALSLLRDACDNKAKRHALKPGAPCQ